MTIAVRDGGIDPDLLDSSRVTTPSTRTLDLAALGSMFGLDLEGREIDLFDVRAKKRKARADN